jgi:hypothetical protein
MFIINVHFKIVYIKGGEEIDMMRELHIADCGCRI